MEAIVRRLPVLRLRRARGSVGGELGKREGLWLVARGGVVPAQATATASVVLLHWREADSAQAELVALARG